MPWRKWNQLKSIVMRTAIMTMKTTPILSLKISPEWEWMNQNKHAKAFIKLKSLWGRHEKLSGRIFFLTNFSTTSLIYKLSNHTISLTLWIVKNLCLRSEHLQSINQIRYRYAIYILFTFYCFLCFLLLFISSFCVKNEAPEVIYYF